MNNAVGLNLIRDIPLEIRIHMYNYLENDDRLRMRETCRQVKKEMDNYVDFQIRLDQSFKGFRRLTNLRVVSCTVVRLTQRNLPRNGIFRYPDRVKKLIFDGTISISNLRLVLKQCVEVEQLVFTHETLGIANLLSSSEKLLNKLKQVTHINLQLLRYPLPDPTYNRISNMLAFLHSTFPSLISFKLYFSVWGQWIDLFKFLQRHSEKLTELELQVGDRCDTRNTEFYLRMHPTANQDLLNAIDMKKLKRLKLKEFQFRDDVLCLNTTVSNILLEILKEQTGLEMMQFHSPGEMSLANLQNIVKANEKTLEELVVYNLKNDQAIPVAPPMLPGVGEGNANEAEDAFVPLPPPQRLVLDMSIFLNCKNIRTLALSCVAQNRTDNVIPIKMTHLEAIPNTIERFHTLGFTFLGDDIINLSRNSPNLKELLMMDAGSMKYSNVITTVLRNCPELEYISIRPVVPRGSNEDAWWAEVLALSKLYSRFMGVVYDPIDDLDGFEARLTDADREWVFQNMSGEISNHPPD